jgi:hypothetical protein
VERSDASPDESGACSPGILDRLESEYVALASLIGEVVLRA